ncbi:hypothetical protein OPKNFCMD_0779 [Methylobacterium crusticola]|uniref:VanZ family protein n=1 Tax=Methylobacterium crusticola TaxID=1697972 RepID=A0ABQ4QRY2_9HYPH|nr:VanZ family protein [Methylobacterium crusticola]GJD48063.1 hypothetical protein OPKNFCMD_0779 [Methylobacterium crusticola]
MSNVARILGWLLLATIVTATICPIGYRPISGAPVSVERFTAFAALAFLFAVGYPRRRWQVLVLTIAAAGGLEALQLLEPSRHGRVADFLVKVGGCGFGAAASLAAGLLPGIALPAGRRDDA